ncbi:hypothetical protein [Spirosoma arcticum]
MVRVDLLPRIQSAQEFFDADKILFIDLISFATASAKIRSDVLRHGAITIDGKVYGPVHLFGSSENLMLHVTKGVTQQVGSYGFFYKWDGDLEEAINAGQVLRFDQYYTETKPYNFAYETGFWEAFLLKNSR